MSSQGSRNHGGKRTSSGRKKVGRAFREVRSLRLTGKVYGEYCQLRGSGHFGSDEDFLAHLLPASERSAGRSARWSVRRLLPVEDAVQDPSTRPTGTPLFFSPGGSFGDVVASTSVSSRVQSRRYRLFQDRLSPVASAPAVLDSTCQIDVTGASPFDIDSSSDERRLREVALADLLSTSVSDNDGEATGRKTS